MLLVTDGRAGAAAAFFGGAGLLSVAGTAGLGMLDTAVLDEDPTPLFHTFCTIDLADERNPNRVVVPFAFSEDQSVS